MTPGQIKAEVITELEQNSVAIKALIEPPFKLQEALDVITEAVDIVELVSPSSITGRQKKEIVRGVLQWADEKFGFSAAIVKAIIPGWLRWLPVKKIIKKLIPLLVDFVVSILNKYVWKAATDEPE